MVVTLKKIRAMVAASNGLDVRTVRAQWVQRPCSITYPTGLKGMVGSVLISAPGFNTTELPVSADAYQVWVGR
jgi:hypothetical protein